MFLKWFLRILKYSREYLSNSVTLCEIEDWTCSPSHSLISRGWREKTETMECCLFHVLQALSAALLQALLKLASFSVQIVFLQTGIRDKELLSLALRIFFSGLCLFSWTSMNWLYPNPITVCTPAPNDFMITTLIHKAWESSIAFHYNILLGTYKPEVSLNRNQNYW